MAIELIFLAAVAGWALDDMCPSPPRPWPPGPGPGPWWLRKIIAAIGGGLAHIVFTRGIINEVPDLLGTVAVGAVGGVFLASLVSGAMGRFNAPDVQTRG
ncbi:MAG TPA: hypothetical protein VF650_13720 [Allosphingosinicella sp.]|jgi:hypothetical protein